jgi:hypothetical protein
MTMPVSGPDTSVSPPPTWGGDRGGGSMNESITQSKNVKRIET